MDVDATYALMVDPASDLDEAAVAATDLLVWAAGLNEPRTSMSSVVREQCQHAIFRALDELARLQEAK